MIIVIIAIVVMLPAPTAANANANTAANNTAANTDEAFIMPNLAYRQRGEAALMVGMVGKGIKKRLVEGRHLPAIASGGRGWRV